MGRKLGRGLCPFLGRGAWSTSNTVFVATSLPSGILIHLTIWPQQIWAENWGLCHFGGERAGSLSNTIQPGRSLPACQASSWSIRPTVSPQYTNVTDRQTDRQTRQRFDSTGIRGSRCGRGSPPPAIWVRSGCDYRRKFEILNANFCFLAHLQPYS